MAIVTPGYVYDALAAAVRTVATAIGTPGATVLSTRAQTLVRDPPALAVGLVAAVGEVDDDARLEALAGDGAALRSVVGTTPWRLAQGRRERALVALVRAAATTALARRSAVRTYPHRAAAIERRDVLAERLDVLAAGATDEMFTALRELRAAVTAHVRAIAPGLARLVDITPRTTLPSLVIAYDLHEGVAHAGDLAASNQVSRPGFVPPRPLQVLAL